MIKSVIGATRSFSSGQASMDSF